MSTVNGSTILEQLNAKAAEKGVTVASLIGADGDMAAGVSLSADTLDATLNAVKPKKSRAAAKPKAATTAKAATPMAEPDYPRTYEGIVAWTHKAVAVISRTPGKDGKIRKGINVVYSGFNNMLRERFNLNKDQARNAVDKMLAEGKLQGHPTKGGYMIYLPGTMPEHTGGKSLLAKYGL